MPNLRTNRRLHKSAVALTGAAALTALLTACNGNINGTFSDASPKPTTANANANATATPAPVASATTGTGTGTGTTAGGSAPACQASQLGYSWADTNAAPSGGSGQMHATVALTNNSGHTCTMYGFPGVDLVNSGDQWSLRRDNTTPHTVTLANGTSAHFTITYLTAQNGDSGAFRPTTVVMTAPNQRTSYDLPWRFGPVLKQDGATHPGTFIGPVGK
jgi:hypothetical protein